MRILSFLILLIIAAGTILVYLDNDEHQLLSDKPTAKIKQATKSSFESRGNLKLKELSYSEGEACSEIDSIHDHLTNKWQKKSQIMAILDDMNEQEGRLKIIDAILDATGVGVYQGHRYLRGNDTQSVRHLNAETIEFITTYKGLGKKLMSIVSDNDIQGLTELYTKNSSIKNKQVLINQQNFTPYQLILSLTQGQNTEEYQLVQAVQKLTSTGVPVRLLDLISYTDKGVSVEIVQALESHFEGDIDLTFFYQQNIHTLVSVAVNNGHFALARYWLSEGINSTPLKFRSSAIDFLTQYQSMEQLTDMLLLLSDYGVLPNSSETYTFLDKTLTNSFKNKHKKLLTDLNFNLLTSEDINTLDQYKNQIFAVAMNNIQLPDNCVTTESDKRQLVKHIFSLKEKPQISINTEEEAANINQEISSISMLPSIEVPEALDATKKKINKVAQRNVRLLKSGQWKKLLHEKLASGDITEDEKLDASFNLGLLGGASSKELIEMIDNGAFVSPDLLMIIISRCDISVLKALQQSGFDFHYQYPDGSNAITISVIENKVDSLRYFLSLGVEVNVVNEVDDPLGTALSGVPFNQKVSLEMVRLLMNAGIRIEEPHRHQVATFISSNFELYSYLITEYPKLKI